MPPKKPRPFVKSADTRTPAMNSRAELERILMRYGCDSFTVREDYTGGTIEVGFVVPPAPGQAARVPVRIPVAVSAVYEALYGPVGARGPDAKLLEQARRVAWRHLLLWIDAALSSASAGLSTITESLFANVLSPHDGRRMVDVVRHEVPEAMPALTDGAPRRLPPGRRE